MLRARAQVANLRRQVIRGDRQNREALRRLYVRRGQLHLPSNVTGKAISYLMENPALFTTPNKGNIDRDKTRCASINMPFTYNLEFVYEICYIIHFLRTQTYLPFNGVTPNLKWLQEFLAAFDPQDTLRMRLRIDPTSSVETDYANHMQEMPAYRRNLGGNAPVPANANPDQVEPEQPAQPAQPARRANARQGPASELGALRSILRSSQKSIHPDTKLIHKSSNKILGAVRNYITETTEVDFELSKLYIDIQDLTDRAVDLLERAHQQDLLNEPMARDDAVPREHFGILDMIVPQHQLNPLQYVRSVLALGVDLLEIIRSRSLGGGFSIMATEEHTLMPQMSTTLHGTLMDLASACLQVTRVVVERQFPDRFHRDRSELACRLVGCSALHVSMINCVKFNLSSADALRACRVRCTMNEFLNHLQQTITRRIPPASALYQSLMDEDPDVLAYRADISNSYYAMFKFMRKYGDPNIVDPHDMDRDLLFRGREDDIDIIFENVVQDGNLPGGLDDQPARLGARPFVAAGQQPGPAGRGRGAGGQAGRGAEGQAGRGAGGQVGRGGGAGGHIAQGGGVGGQGAQGVGAGGQGAQGVGAGGQGAQGGGVGGQVAQGFGVGGQVVNNAGQQIQPEEMNQENIEENQPNRQPNVQIPINPQLDQLIQTFNLGRPNDPYRLNLLKMPPNVRERRIYDTIVRLKNNIQAAIDIQHHAHYNADTMALHDINGPINRIEDCKLELGLQTYYSVVVCQRAADNLRAERNLAFAAADPDELYFIDIATEIYNAACNVTPAILADLPANRQMMYEYPAEPPGAPPILLQYAAPYSLSHLMRIAEIRPYTQLSLIADGDTLIHRNYIREFLPRYFSPAQVMFLYTDDYDDQAVDGNVLRVCANIWNDYLPWIVETLNNACTINTLQEDDPAFFDVLRAVVIEILIANNLEVEDERVNGVIVNMQQPRNFVVRYCLDRVSRLYAEIGVLVNQFQHLRTGRLLLAQIAESRNKLHYYDMQIAGLNVFCFVEYLKVETRSTQFIYEYSRGRCSERVTHNQTKLNFHDYVFYYYWTPQSERLPDMYFGQHLYMQYMMSGVNNGEVVFDTAVADFNRQRQDQTIVIALYAPVRDQLMTLPRLRELQLNLMNHMDPAIRQQWADLLVANGMNQVQRYIEEDLLVFPAIDRNNPQMFPIEVCLSMALYAVSIAFGFPIHNRPIEQHDIDYMYAFNAFFNSAISTLIQLGNMILFSNLQDNNQVLTAFTVLGLTLVHLKRHFLVNENYIAVCTQHQLSHIVLDANSAARTVLMRAGTPAAAEILQVDDRNEFHIDVAGAQAAVEEFLDDYDDYIGDLDGHADDANAPDAGNNDNNEDDDIL